MELPVQGLIWGLAYIPPTDSQGVDDEMDLGRGQPREYIEPGKCPAVANRDSDGDCILDFDEIERFHTDPNNPDTDSDGVPDMLDLREYVYDGHADRPDFDGDGLRKETDPNNDDDCYLDGEEDINVNGQHDGDESSNFDEDPECYWTGEERVTFSASIEGMGTEEEYEGYIEFLETAIDHTKSVLSEGQDVVYFYPRTFGGLPVTIESINPPPPYTFGIVGYIERTPEGRFLYLKKEPPDIMPTMTTSTPMGPTTAIYPNPIAMPGIWYAVDPFAVYAGSSFPEWINHFEQIFIDADTNEVWLKLHIDASDPKNLVARWQETIEATEVRDGVTGTLDIHIELMFRRGW
jgi:hypothetical protein